MNRPVRTARLAAPALLVLLAGCGGSGDPEAGASQSVAPVRLPAGESYASSGATLDLGKAAVVQFAPNPKKNAALSITVLDARAGIIADLRGYQLSQAARLSTPYYVQVKVENLAGSDVARSAIPLWGTTADGALIGASAFTKPFATCPSTPLPASFKKGAEVTTCLMYLMPGGTRLDAVAFRAPGSTKGISWSVPQTMTQPASTPSASASASPTAGATP